MSTKTCQKCCLSKPTEQFHKLHTSADGLTPLCAYCRNERARKWKQKNRESLWNSRLKHKFSITSAEYVELLARQNGVCAICERPERVKRNGVYRKLAVDHDRKCCPTELSCGRCVRGLLCHSCNTGIGKLDDSTVLLLKAIQYINNHNSKGDNK